jgi:diaminopimelate epimerase
VNLSYVVYDPTKNITALVTSPVPRAQQAAAANALMAQLPDVEQVGFLETPTLSGAAVRLQMMGGEFCGNATMSAAAYLSETGAAAHGGICFGGSVPLEVSGVRGVLRCNLEHRAEGGFFGTVAMPLPVSIRNSVALPLELKRRVYADLVEFPGITHCIVSTGELSREEVEAMIRPQFSVLCERLHTDACGILLYDAVASSFAPLVYVASTGSAVWESGCGSGSAAIGAYTADQANHARKESATSEISLRQPGGVIKVCAAMENGTFTALTITGCVRRCGSGTFTF